MPDTPELQALETRRAALRQQLASIGDLRAGSLFTRYRRCGKPNCHCATDDSRGHGPIWALTRPIPGGTQTRVIPPEAVERTREQLSECQRFRRLAREMIEVSSTLCDTRLTASRKRATEAAKKGGSAPRSRRRAPPKSSG